MITGCARSGTSLTTGILKACGLNIGDVNVLNEHTGIRDGLNKPHLKALGADPLGQGPLPDTGEVKPVKGWAEFVSAKLQVREPCGFKDAKTCLIWPIWAAAFPEAKWVIVRRDRERIIDSCLRTHFMKRYSDREGWGRWVDHHEDRFNEIMANCDALEVWPDMNPETFRPAVEFCGLQWDAEAVKKVIRPAEWH